MRSVLIWVMVELKGAKIKDFEDTFLKSSSPVVSSHYSVKHSELTSDCSVWCLSVFVFQLVPMFSYGPFLLNLVLLERKSFLIYSISYSLKNFISSSMFCIQGCIRISGIFSLVFGSQFNILWIKSLASADISSFNEYLAFLIRRCNSCIELPLNGTLPYSIAYRTTPADQISA